MVETRHASKEAFQPIALRAPGEAPWLFALRCVVDFQVLTIHRFLRPRLARLEGRVLDVGAGQSPWRAMLSRADYVGIDVERADDFGMRRNPAVVHYDGRIIPFPDGAFDHVLCVEVLEHVDDAEAFVCELARVLGPGGSLVLTIPWSARLHHLPHDYRRYTRHGLQRLLAGAGFRDIEIGERGNDVAVVANKLIVIGLSLVRARGGAVLWRWPLALLLAPVTAAFIVAAHVSLVAGLGSRHDPLGYGVVAIRS